METFLVRLALNRDQSFTAAVSGAGAQGLAQFLPSTYKATARTHPDYGLIPDPKRGLANHLNAVKAMIALLDADLGALPDSVRQRYLANELKPVGALLAASYNGGSLRVQRALEFWGDAWSRQHQADVKKLSSTLTAQEREVKRLKRAVSSENNRKKKATLKADLTSVEAKVKTIKADLPKAKKASLKPETVSYLEKLATVYDMFESGMYATPHAPSGGLPATTKGVALASPLTTNTHAVNPTAEQICFTDGCPTAMQ